MRRPSVDGNVSVFGGDGAGPRSLAGRLDVRFVNDQELRVDAEKAPVRRDEVAPPSYA
jgi:hypothetical protein